MFHKERFFDKVMPEPNTGCWIWTGAMNDVGYGQMRVDYVCLYTHRISYELHVGKIPEGLTIDHKCRNRLCCNPEHLEAVTNRENILRGFSPSAMQARQTHCKNGHEFSGDNLVIRNKRRGCRICIRAKKRKYYWDAKK